MIRAVFFCFVSLFLFVIFSFCKTEENNPSMDALPLLSGLFGESSGTSKESKPALKGFPLGITVDLSGNIVYSVSSGGPYTSQVVRATPAGEKTFFLPSISRADAQYRGTPLIAPRKVAVDPTDQRIYVSNAQGINFSYLYAINGIGMFYGSGSTEGGRGTSEFRYQYGFWIGSENPAWGVEYGGSFSRYPILGGGIVFDSQGNLYVAETYNHCIRKVSKEGIVTVIAGGTYAGFADGPALSARFFLPSGIAIDSSNNIYVADYGNHAIRKISNGVVT
ncbi:hypothetical protein EHQ83_00970, partial [Leptospira yasudae]